VLVLEFLKRCESILESAAQLPTLNPFLFCVSIQSAFGNVETLRGIRMRKPRIESGRERNSCNRKTDEILKPSLREQVLEGFESQISILRDNKNVGDERGGGAS
jgi:hypothetical protein